MYGNKTTSIRLIITYRPELRCMTYNPEMQASVAQPFNDVTACFMAY